MGSVHFIYFQIVALELDVDRSATTGFLTCDEKGIPSGQAEENKYRYSLCIPPHPSKNQHPIGRSTQVTPLTRDRLLLILLPLMLLHVFFGSVCCETY